MRRFIGTLDWAARNVLLDDKRFRPDRFPWLADIAETIDRNRGAIFILMFPPQVFKTLFMQMRVARGVAIEPVRALWYSKTRAESEVLSDSKLSLLLKTTSCLEKLPFDIDARGTKTLYRYSDAPLELLGADIQQHRNSRSGHDLFIDEAWQYEPGHLSEIFRRSDDYERDRRIIIATTGPEVEDAVDTLWDQSTKNEWRVVSLCCNERVPLEFGYPHEPGGIKWDSDEGTREPNGRWKVEAAAATSLWECPACKQRQALSEAMVRQMNERARGAGYELTNPTHNPRVFGWHAEAVVFRDIPAIVSDYLVAHNAKKLGDHSLIEEFQRKRRVRAWDPRMVVSARKDIPFGVYNMGDPWEDEGFEEITSASGEKIKVPMRFLWVDVQQNYFWGVCRQWSNKRETWAHSRLLHFEKLFSAGQIEDLRKRLNIIPRRVILDSAYNQQLVYQICATYGYLCANSVKVRDFLNMDGMRRIYSEAIPVDPLVGRSGGGTFNVFEFKYSTPGSWYRLDALRSSRGPDGKPMWTIPANTPEEYIRQAWAEISERKRNPKGGWVFEIRQIHAENHAQDMERGNVVSGSMLGLLQAGTLEPAAPETDEQKVAQAG